ncbi:transcriptional regulator with XRE-family HTH domain [Pseudomonas sp. JUb42]|jgi:transcriptional regulator with XRE-family HTH domain|uniref:helix-turn-helix domain-containing protein n=1 Tax=Pseudomonas sp. JUb42 TaxID=2940611 RepID=UPI002169817A|nr:helix-turn-helix transcriptional regulator [Pseudomonas sp. JUb42]MCS3468693.1 transcriptional regulator with XRE-family HTH domain [Pseudomonas sp. JUb42]
MKELGTRLRAERKRLGLSQQALGAMGGVAANAQGKYESGERLPKADYLVALARGGVDVLYVLTERMDQDVRNPEAVITPQDVLLKEVEMAVRAFTVAMETARR